MDRKHNSKIVPFAKELRKNMTKEERHLWYDFLRNYPETIPQSALQTAPFRQGGL
jgi:very-short-patch-repair endonuclease